MKAQYIGDVKDYGKFRFLRLLCETTGLRLGVNWYLTANDTSKQGNFGSIPNCQDSLYSVVAQLKKPNASAQDVAFSGILPESTVYYDSVLAYTTQPVNRTRRYNWHQAALKALDSCDIIFLDPDTGVIANNYHDKKGVAKDNFFRPNEKRDGTRYVSITEIQNYLADGKGLVLFQYGARVVGINAQLQTVCSKLTKFVGKPTASYIFRYSQSVNDGIAFICYSQPPYAQRMERFEKALLNPQAQWGNYYSKWGGVTPPIIPVKPRQVAPKTNLEQKRHSMETANVTTQKLRESAPPQEKLRVLIMQIPEGKVTTYGWLSTQIYGHAGASQGILSMIKPLAYTSVPCHRVVSNDGQPKALDVNYGNTGKTQKQLLISDGVSFVGSATIDMGKCMCRPKLPHNPDSH